MSGKRQNSELSFTLSSPYAYQEIMQYLPVCFPSNHGVSTVQMKNCDPFVLGPALAIELEIHSKKKMKEIRQNFENYSSATNNSIVQDLPPFSKKNFFHNTAIDNQPYFIHTGYPFQHEASRSSHLQNSRNKKQSQYL